MIFRRPSALIYGQIDLENNKWSTIFVLTVIIVVIFWVVSRPFVRKSAQSEHFWIGQIVRFFLIRYNRNVLGPYLTWNYCFTYMITGY